MLLYNYVKFRGHKTIGTSIFFHPSVAADTKYSSVRYFPHEIADLSIALDFMTREDSPIHDRRDNQEWALRYVSLLWLSLVVRIPFDLALFDPEDQPDKSANTIQALGENYLAKAGLERTAAAILLSRLFMRLDSFCPQLGQPSS
jgi:tubulin-specific chaperone D